MFPGGVFSLDNKHSDYLRLNAGGPVTGAVVEALRWLGRATSELAGGCVME